MIPLTDKPRHMKRVSSRFGYLLFISSLAACEAQEQPANPSASPDQAQESSSTDNGQPATPNAPPPEQSNNPTPEPGDQSPPDPLAEIKLNDELESKMDQLRQTIIADQKKLRQLALLAHRATGADTVLFQKYGEPEGQIVTINEKREVSLLLPKIFDFSKYTFGPQKLRSADPQYILEFRSGEDLLVKLEIDHRHGFVQELDDRGKYMGKRFETQPAGLDLESLTSKLVSE